MTSTGPFGLVILGLVAVAIVAGTFTLLVLGRPVPEPIWVAWGVVVTALFGHGAFLAQAATHRAVVGELMDAVQTGAGAAAAGSGVTTTTTEAKTNHGTDTGGATGA